MTLAHGQTATGVLTPLLVDATGRPLVVVDSIGTVTVVGAVNATVVSPLTVGGAVKVDQQTLPVPVSDNGGSLTVDGTVAVSTSPIHVDDNGGSLTVDGSVTVSGTVTADTELPAAAALADGSANPTAPFVAGAALGFNGVTWDRKRNNIVVVLRALAVYTTTYAVQHTNHDARGVLVALNVTSAPGGQTLTPTIYGVLPDQTGTSVTLLTDTAFATTGIKTYLIYPEAATAGIFTKSVQSPLPRDWYLQIAHSGAGNWTYSLGYHSLN